MTEPRSTEIERRIAQLTGERWSRAIEESGRGLQNCRTHTLDWATMLTSSLENLVRFSSSLVEQCAEAARIGRPYDASALVQRIATEQASVGAALIMIKALEVDVAAGERTLREVISGGPESFGEDATIADLRRALAETRQAERWNIRREIRHDEWADLPKYHGTGTRERKYCLHCGGDLENGQRAFCSDHCKEVHQSVYGVFDDADETDG